MKKGGFPGGMGIPGGMNNLMKQAQRMQRQMEQQQKELEEKEFTGTAGGGAVTVTMSGKRIVTKVHIDPAACDPDDAETLEEMVMAAVNNACEQINDAGAGNLGALAGGLGGGLGQLGGMGL